MLLEAAIGDAYGAGFECAPEAFVRKNNCPSKYVLHPKYTNKKGRYTDDTQMSLALAELMLTGVKWTKEVLAQKFVDVFKRDPRTGYAGHFYTLLKEVGSGTELMEKITPNSERNGAAMRASVLGLYPDIDEVFEKAILQATVTHDTEAGRNSAVVAALCTHYLYYQIGDPIYIGEWINYFVEGEWDVDWAGWVPIHGPSSVLAVITALKKSHTLHQVLKASIDFTGDVDTVACIALNAAATHPYYIKNIQRPLFLGLENNTYGRDYLVNLDRALYLQFPK